MLDEAAGVMWRTICFITRTAVEVGFDLGLKIPGLIVQKIFWPPYWFSRVEESPVTYLAGVCFYIVAGALFFGFCCE